MMRVKLTYYWRRLSTLLAEAVLLRHCFSLIKNSNRSSLFALFATTLLVFSVFFNLLAAPSVSATPNSDGVKILRASFVATCIGPLFRGSDRANNTIENIQSYKGVLIGDTVAGHIIDASDGLASCNNNSSETLKRNLAILGYSDLLDVMRVVGCTQNSNSTSYTCPMLGNPQIYNKIAEDKSIPPLSDAIKYYLAFNTFTAGCKAAPTGASSGSADWQAARAQANNLHILTVVGSDGKDVEAVYKAELDNDRKISTINPSAGWINDGSFECATLANMTRTYAQSYVDWIGDAPNDELDGALGVNDQGKDNSATSCAIDGIGWILCPVINTMAGFADGAFNVISDSFLRTDVSVVAQGSPAHKAWIEIRNIANIVFVIVFLIIIFSQLTGTGITNYGVKKMLPRLAVAAILVNVSFLICQIAVDLSNILGYSIIDALNSIRIPGGTDVEVGRSFLATGNKFSEITVGVIAFGAGVAAIYALLSVLGPVLLAAIVALAVILFILIARQALIVILIVLAPLAFVAFLLPNTNKLFTQWRKMFTALLLVFPIIALVFGLSQLASEVISSSFSIDTTQIVADADDIDSEAQRTTMTGWFGQIIGAAILTLPLFVVPMILKKSLDGIPMLGKMADKWGSRTGAGLGSKMKESYRGSRVGRGAAIRKQGRENYRARKFAEGLSNSKVNRALAGGVGITRADSASREQLMKSATASNVKALREETDDAKKLIEMDNLSGEARQQLALTGVAEYEGKKYSGESMQRAAIEMQMGGAGSYGERMEIVKATKKGDKKATNPEDRVDGALAGFRQIISQGAISAGSSDPTLSGARIDQISQGTYNHDTATLKAIKDGKFTSDAMASMHVEARQHAIEVAKQANANGDGSYLAALQKAVIGVEDSADMRAKIAGDEKARAQFEELKTLTAAPPAAPPTAAPATPSSPSTPAANAPQDNGGTLAVPHNPNLPPPNYPPPTDQGS